MTPAAARLPLGPVVTYNPATCPPLLLLEFRMAQGTTQASAATIYVLNGPNLNMLGIREPEKYGHASLADVEHLCVETAAQFGLKADCRQSNREGELIDFIHEAHAKKVAGIIINAGGYSHTSIALHDALVAVKIPTVEVHISNVHARESFRHHSYTAMAAFASLCRLRHRWLPARDQWPCRQTRRQGQNLTSKPDSRPRHPQKFRIKIMARQPDNKSENQPQT